MRLIDQIREALRASGGMTVAQLAEALPGLETKQIGNLCYQAKYKGEFTTRMEDGRVVYAIAEGDSTPASATSPKATSKKAKVEPPSAKRKRDFFAAAESADKTLKALLFARDTARDALQVYVCSVADPVIYTALKNAELSAQAAVDQFTARGASE